MLLSEEVASSLEVLCNRFKEAIPTMTDRELYNCLCILNKSQTSAEKTSASTIDKNGKGFTSIDAKPFSDAIKEYLQNGRFVEFHTRNLVRYRLRKYADQLIRYWISKGKINNVKRGEYSYTSKAEREANRLAALDAKIAQGAADFRKQQEELNALHKTPEYQLQQRVEKNHGQLDFLNDLQ